MNVHVPPCTISIAVQKPLVIRDPKDSTKRTKIVPRPGEYIGCWAQKKEWIILPEFNGYGLPRREWARHWHDLTVEMLELREREWQTLFEDNEPYE